MRQLWDRHKVTYIMTIGGAYLYPMGSIWPFFNPFDEVYKILMRTQWWIYLLRGDFVGGCPHVYLLIDVDTRNYEENAFKRWFIQRMGGYEASGEGIGDDDDYGDDEDEILILMVMMGRYWFQGSWQSLDDHLGRGLLQWEAFPGEIWPRAHIPGNVWFGWIIRITMSYS